MLILAARNGNVSICCHLLLQIMHFIHPHRPNHQRHFSGDSVRNIAFWQIVCQVCGHSRHFIFAAYKLTCLDSILVRAYEDRTDLLRSVIIGPENTPYEDAPFVIDWMLDSNFPHSPPIAHFLSWTNGNGRGKLLKIMLRSALWTKDHAIYLSSSESVSILFLGNHSRCTDKRDYLNKGIYMKKAKFVCQY